MDPRVDSPLTSGELTRTLLNGGGQLARGPGELTVKRSTQRRGVG